jgi:hypothetical protein
VAAAAAAGLALLIPAAASAQSGTSAAEAVAALNAQRAAHGIPADLVENPDYSLGCRQHMAYEELNGRSTTQPHAEDPAKPGYTPLGDQAARASVLGSASSTWAAGNPWENAPIHLMDTLAPALAQTGWAPGCMWTVPTVPRPAPDDVKVFTYPGAGSSIYPAQVASEWPFVPGDFVGLPQGTLTGPHILVMPFGQVTGLDPGEATGRTRIVAASLAGPDGLVEVRTVDESTTGALGDLGRYLEGGMLIPVVPLRPSARYTARAALLYRGVHPLDVSWNFHTGEVAAGPPRRPRVQVARVVRTPTRVKVTLLGAEASGRPARIATQKLGRVCRPGGACWVRPVGAPAIRKVTLRPRQTIALPRTRLGHRIVVVTKPFTAAGSRFLRARLVRTVP